MEHGFSLARKLGIKRVLVFASLISDRRLVEKRRDAESLIWVTTSASRSLKELRPEDQEVQVPDHLSGGADLVTFALITAALRGVVDPGETVLCLAGAAGSRHLDNLLIVNPQRDFPWFRRSSGKIAIQLSNPQTFIRLMDIALRFGAEGREGKSIGSIFLLCDPSDAEPYSRSLILNPCKGHPKKVRSVFDEGFVETMRELAALDGAFVIDHKGVVERAGVYLDAPATGNVKVGKGLGARHMAAACMSGVIDCTAVVVSESSGTVTVFFAGREALSLKAAAV